MPFNVALTFFGEDIGNVRTTGKVWLRKKKEFHVSARELSVEYLQGI
jgi:hypothetical protein